MTETRFASSRVVRGMAWLVEALVVSALVASGAAAVSLPADKFGTLDQATTNCPDLGCAPTAAVNSFVYLQNMFPEVYGTALVPTGNGAPTADEMRAVANDLGANFMGSCTLCAGSPHGTFIEDFILGKVAYIESRVPGRTEYAAQISIPWRETIRDADGNVIGAHPGTPKPAFVEDRRTPTPEFLIQQITDGEDVEIFIAGLVGEFVPIAHALTLTGITFSHETQRGTIQYVDPLGGVRGEANIVGFDRLPLPGTPPQFWPFLLAIDYMGGRVDIFHAVSESVPAPASVMLLGLGFGGAVLWIRATVRRRA